MPTLYPPFSNEILGSSNQSTSFQNYKQLCLKSKFSLTFSPFSSADRSAELKRSHFHFVVVVGAVY